MKGNKFDTEYNEWLHQVDVGESDSVWAGVEDELDFMETWDNISMQLDVVMPPPGSMFGIKYLKPFVAAAAIILLMLLPVKDISDRAAQPVILTEQPAAERKTEELTPDETLPVKVKKEEVVKPRVASVNHPPIERIDKSTTSVVPENKENSLTAFIESKDVEDIPETEPVDLKYMETPLTESKDAEPIAAYTRGTVWDKIQPLSFNYNDLSASYDAVSPEFMQNRTSTYAEPGKSSRFTVRIAEVGLVYGYKNTWLLNYETRNGLDPEKLGNTLPTFHQDIGASTTLEFNHRYRIGMEFLKSETGQDYQQYINASYVDKKIDLNYLKFQTFYILDSKRIPGHAIFGGYIARLAGAEEQQAQTRFSIDENYTNLDYGLLTGYQFNFALSNRFSIKPGLRVNYNLINIFKGDDIMPGHFKKTKNLAGSFNVSLSYRFFE